MLPQEELRHFETKVEKHNHYQEQLELSHQKLQHVEALGDKEHIRKTQDKYHTLAEKTKEIGYKVGGRRFRSSLCDVTKGTVFVCEISLCFIAAAGFQF